MREILFRGQTKNQEWVEGYYEKKPNGKTYILNRCTDAPDGDPMWRKVLIEHEVIEETVSQYTGLADKNGKKIFEGDIVAYQYDNDDCPFPNKDTRKRIGRVFFQDWRASFAVAEGRNGSDMCNQDLFNYVRNGNRTEVIGNIYDNPDLIGYKKGAGA